MKNLIKSCAVALAAFAAAPAFVATPAVALDVRSVLPSAGDDIVRFRTFGAWAVMQNNTDGNCFASRADNAGNIIQMGVTKDRSFGYLGAFTSDGRLAGDGAKIVAVVNGNLYSGEAHGVSHGLNEGRTGGFILVNNTNFVRDIEASREIVFFPDTPNTVTLNTRRARDAIYEARKCMDAM